MNGRFNSKVALVTGASVGIGRAIALAFAREGAALVLGNRDVDRGEETAALAREAGAQVRFVPTDVTHVDQVEALVAAAIDTFGRLDIAVNNAGAAIASRKLTHEHSDDDWAATLAVNLTAVFTGMRAQVARMLEHGGGAIVNIASVGGVVGSRLGGAAYTAAKHGVVGLTRIAAAEYAARGIRVNAVCPGPIHTSVWDPVVARPKALELATARIPARRLGTVEEVAGSVLWLASDENGYLTGQAIVIDGGITAAP